MVNFVVKQNIIAYHTSDLTEPIDDLKVLTPFHSNVNEQQWLGQGYYFWTDDDFYAHLWGCLKIKNDEGISQYKYKNGYVITQFNISIEPNNLLDLVGNARQQIYFYKLVKLYREEYCIDDIEDIPVSKIIDYCKLKSQDNFNVFPYFAIKACDTAKNSKYFPFTTTSSETLILPTRQQLCVFSLYKNEIISSPTIHQIVDKSTRALDWKNKRYLL